MIDCEALDVLREKSQIHITVNYDNSPHPFKVEFLGDVECCSILKKIQEMDITMC